MEAFAAFFSVWTDPQLILLVAAGTFAGIYVGAIPGLSVTMAVSILISFTFSWDVLPAIALMIGVYMGGVYGGSRTAILLNIPGAPSAIATAMDGYPMAQKGEAGVAIGVTTVMSFFGGLIAQYERDFVDFALMGRNQELGVPSIATGHFFGTDSSGRDTFRPVTNAGARPWMVWKP